MLTTSKSVRYVGSWPGLNIESRASQYVLSVVESNALGQVVLYDTVNVYHSALQMALYRTSLYCRTHVIIESFAQKLSLSYWIFRKRTHWHLFQRQRKRARGT
jgi:hypothetical protein